MVNVRRKVPLRKLIMNVPYELFLLIVVILWMILLGVLARNFFMIDNLMTVGRRMSESGIVALGMTLVILSGGIDLSVGSIMALTVAIGGTLFAKGIPLWVAFSIGIVPGIGVGFVNSFLIIKARLQPIIVTLATMIIARSLAYGITSGKAVGEFPQGFAFLGQGSVIQIPMPLIIFLVFVGIIAFILYRTRTGRYIYAVGGNENAAYNTGIKIANIKYFVYLFSAIMSSLAGVIYTSRVSSANPAVGRSTALDVITAVLVGGTSIFGGKGNVIGTVLGIFLIDSLINGLHLLGLGGYWEIVFVGCVLLAVVVLEKQRGG
jgi:ribose transport system permease protein